MTTETMTPYRSQASSGHERFWHLLHAEFTKFRTVRGWVITMIIAILATSAFVFLSSRAQCSAGGSTCPPPPAGPGGEPVADAFYVAHQPLTGNGTITVQLTPLTGEFQNQNANGQSVMEPEGPQSWSKAGIIIKENTSQGSAYAAMMVTGSHGVRMQWDYVNDTPGLTGSVSASSPRWLRLVRTGDTIAGYDSADGTHWTLAGTATLPGLPATVQGGLFAASPNDSTSAITLTTGVFRHVGLSWPATGWTGTNVGGIISVNGVGVPDSLRQSGGALTVSGSGDISPLAGNFSVLTVQTALFGSFAAMIALIVVGVMFITTEYRRGMIRVSMTASPRRGRLLAAKAIVIGAVSFVTGMIAAALAIAVGTRVLGKGGLPLSPIPALTEVRMVVGTGALLAVAAVLALAIGTILKRSAAAVTTVIAVTFIPFLLAILPTSPLGLREWLLRITPAAAFSVQQAQPQYSQVIATYTPNGGYYPLAGWAGLAVECAWAAVALTLAFYLLRRRDA
jgi:ABC-type transport system involved in multi-copper enzyme maturation permease subunit